jgi:hypothetical protein
MKKYLPLVILCCLSLSHKALGADNPRDIPFQEITIDKEGQYDIDVDFDGMNEVVQVDNNGNVEVVKIDKNGKRSVVTNELPYSVIRAHSCCEAHRAYTTFNYLQHTIYSEAHYGGFTREISKYKKVGEDWVQVLPTEPFSMINKVLLPQPHIVQRFIGTPCRWYWGNGRGGFLYWLNR